MAIRDGVRVAQSHVKCNATPYSIPITLQAHPFSYFGPEQMATTAESKVESKNDVASGEEKRAEGSASGGGVEVPGAKREEKVGVEVEPRTGISFPVRLEDGKQLNSVGLKKKSMLGVGIKIFGFGIYADNEKLRDLLKSEFREAPATPTKEMYQKVIDSDVGMTVRMVMVFSGLTMGMMRKNFDEGLGGSIKKLTGGQKHEDLTNKILDASSDGIKLPPGSVMEISRLPGYTYQIKVTDKVVSKIQSELLCRAHIYTYLGDTTFDMDAREKFGMSMLKLF